MVICFQVYKVGEHVLARWTDCKMYPAKILSTNDNGVYLCQSFIVPSWLCFGFCSVRVWSLYTKILRHCLLYWYGYVSSNK